MVRTCYLVLKWPVLTLAILALLVLVKYSGIAIVIAAYTMLFYCKDLTKPDDPHFDRLVVKVVPVTAILTASAYTIYRYYVIQNTNQYSGYVDNLALNATIMFFSIIGLSTGVCLSWSITLFNRNPVQFTSNTGIFILSAFLIQYPYGCIAVVGMIALAWLAFKQDYRWIGFIALALSSPLSALLYLNASKWDETNVSATNLVLIFVSIFMMAVIATIISAVPLVLTWMRTKYMDSLSVCQSR